MFRRKLTALDYHNPSGFDCSDETQLRNCIVWLEDQKIRHYKIEDRGNLRNIPSSDWPKAYHKGSPQQINRFHPTLYQEQSGLLPHLDASIPPQYLQDLNCPFGPSERAEAVDWLLGLAVRYEYGDNVNKYRNCQPPDMSGGIRAASDPLVNLDSDSPDFKAGVVALANILKIPRHDDYLVMLKAVRILVQERLSPDAMAKADQSGEGVPVALDQHILGFDTGDATLNEAAQILRLLHIEELRELQTKINEAIVAVQAVIADPKTDHRLGKVGR
uniref:RNA transcription, translation and transport factor protein isoform X2 n=1 Tax=Doryrhamphus excisus TaxID=161450 RepID=UPI0025AE06A2|nr:RNA transcription, translation and transport factor protein isoform X2 [Doryrhamphus excisus]